MAEYNFAPNYNKWWKNLSITKEDFAWVLLGVEPKAMRIASTIKKPLETRSIGRLNRFLRGLPSYRKLPSCQPLEGIHQVKSTHEVLLRLDWGKDKEAFLNMAYQHAYDFPPDFLAFLKSIDKSPHDPALEARKDFALYRADLSACTLERLNALKGEDEALSCLLGLEPVFWEKYTALNDKQGAAAEAYASFTPQEKWLLKHYTSFLKEEFPTFDDGRSAFNQISMCLQGVKALDNWNGDFAAYVQALHDDGVLFRPETYVALIKHKIPLSYTENGWAMKFNRRWLNQGIWSLKTAANIYLGACPENGGRGFIVLGHTGLHGAGAGLALESDGRIVEYDNEGKLVPPPDDPLADVFDEDQDKGAEWHMLEKFVRGHITGENLTPKEDKGKGQLSFVPKVIVEFFRDHLPRTFQPKALLIALGLNKDLQDTDVAAKTETIAIIPPKKMKKAQREALRIKKAAHVWHEYQLAHRGHEPKINQVVDELMKMPEFKNEERGTIRKGLTITAIKAALKAA